MALHDFLSNGHRLLGLSFIRSLKSNLCTAVTIRDTTENSGIISRTLNSGIISRTLNSGIISRTLNSGIISRTLNSGIISRTLNSGIISRTLNITELQSDVLLTGMHQLLVTNKRGTACPAKTNAKVN